MEGLTWWIIQMKCDGWMKRLRDWVMRRLVGWVDLRVFGEGNGSPLQYSCLENPMGRGAWGATVHGVARVGHDLVTKPRVCR